MIELRRALPFLAVVLLVLVAGCSLLGVGTGERDRLGAELRAAEARWAANGPSAYRFTIRYSCFCPWTDPLTVTVEDRRVVSVIMNGEDVPDAGRMGVPLLIESAFEHVRDNLDASAIEAEFDPVLGYPVAVNADPVKEAVDEEFSFEISDFEALP